MSVIPIISPSTKSPQIAISVNLKAGAPSPGSAVRRCLIMATKASTGTITPDTDLRKNVSADAIKELLGRRAVGHLAALRLFEEHRLARVDLISPKANDSATAAVGAVTFKSGPPSVDRTVRATIAGRRIDIVWRAGESNEDGAEKLTAAIAAFGDDLPVTAAAAAVDGGPEWATNLTFVTPGPIGNDCLVYVDVIGGAGGEVTAPADNKLASGSGEPDYSNAIDAIAGEDYDLILNCCSNADAQDGTSSSNPGRVKTDIELRKTGAAAKLQQQVVGLTGALAAALTGVGNINDEETQYVFALNCQSLPCEWGGAEAGARLREEQLDPAKNRIAMPYRARLFGPRNMATDRPDPDSEIEVALSTGLSIVNFAEDGTPFPSRPITSYHKMSDGSADDRVLDISIPTGCFAILRDLRTFLRTEFPNKKLSRDLEPGDDPPPPDVVEVRDIKSSIDQRMRLWIRRGVARRDKWEEAVADGTFYADVNPDDPSQLDVVLPMSIVPPLAKMGIDARHIRN